MLLSAGSYSAVITVFSLTIDWLLVSLGLLVSSKVGNLWFADAVKRWGVVDYLRGVVAMATGPRVQQTDVPPRVGGPSESTTQPGVAKKAMFGFLIILIARRLLAFSDVVLLSLGPTEDRVSESQSIGSDECKIGIAGLVSSSGNRSEICVTTENGGVESSTEELCSQSAYGLPTRADGYEGMYVGFFSYYSNSYPDPVVAEGDARLSDFTGWTQHVISTSRPAPYSPYLILFNKEGDEIGDHSGLSNGLVDDTLAVKDVVVVNGSDVAQLTIGARRYELRYGYDWETGTTAMGARIEEVLNFTMSLTGVVLDLEDIYPTSEYLISAELDDYDGPSELQYRTLSRISHGNEVVHSLSSVIEITFSIFLSTDDELYFQLSDVNIWEVYSYSLSLDQEGPFLSEWPVKRCDSNFDYDNLKFRGSSLFYCSGNTFDSTLGDVISGAAGQETLLVLDERTVYMDNGGIGTDDVITLPEGLSEIVAVGDDFLLYEDPDGSILAAGLSGECTRTVAVTESLYVVNVWYLLSVSICIAVAAVVVWVGLRNIASVYQASPWDVIRSQMSGDDSCQAGRRHDYFEVTPLNHKGHTYINVGGNVMNSQPGARVEGTVIKTKRDANGGGVGFGRMGET